MKRWTEISMKQRECTFQPAHASFPSPCMQAAVAVECDRFMLIRLWVAVWIEPDIRPAANAARLLWVGVPRVHTEIETRRVQRHGTVSTLIFQRAIVAAVVVAALLLLLALTDVLSATAIARLATTRRNPVAHRGRRRGRRRRRRESDRRTEHGEGKWSPGRHLQHARRRIQ